MNDTLIARRDLAFQLYEVHDAEGLLAYPRYEEHSRETFDAVLDTASRMAEDLFAPHNRQADEQEPKMVDGKVVLVSGVREAVRAYCDAGFLSATADEAAGGMQLPVMVAQGCLSVFRSANVATTSYVGLTSSNANVIEKFGSSVQKARYLAALRTGRFFGTMALTEPQAGSSLSDLKTSATPREDGSYLIKGQKIFISGGDHELSDNIVHLVLARLPQAPPGPRGLSLLLVPKRLADGTANAVVCERIEEKMGLHASPTCVMRFDGATGWLIGTPGQGLSAMFVMMNAARLHVALQGVGLLESAWQIANAYAHERRQMRAPAPHRAPGAASGPDLLIAHPAIQRLLDTQRAWIDGGRVLAYQTAIELDLADHHPDALRRERARRWCALITPVLKAALTAQAFHGASDCLQVLGGHGYVREWGIEQVLRDARVAMIYEGTNEIQAIDLLVRKVLGDGGASLRAWLEDLQSDLAPQCPAAHRLHQLEAATQALVARAAQDGQHAYWVAADYLQAVALALMGWAWARIDATTGAQAPRWRAPSRALHAWVAPAFDHHLRLLHTGLEANQS